MSSVHFFDIKLNKSGLGTYFQSQVEIVFLFAKQIICVWCFFARLLNGYMFLVVIGFLQQGFKQTMNKLVLEIVLHT